MLSCLPRSLRCAVLLTMALLCAACAEMSPRPDYTWLVNNPERSNVVHVMRDFTDPVPPEAKDPDLVTFNFNYHDTVWMGIDRAQMNRAIFNSLKKGGFFVVADHSAKPGSPLEVTKSLHRIDEAIVRREIEAAGFKLAASADFLRSPEHTRELPVSKNLGRNDEFVLKFVKP